MSSWEITTNSDDCKWESGCLCNHKDGGWECWEDECPIKASQQTVSGGTTCCDKPMVVIEEGVKKCINCKARVPLN